MSNPDTFADFLSLPYRARKPRKSGLTIAIDRGVPVKYFKDAIESYGNLIDMVKLGWGTAVVSQHIEQKIAFAESHDVSVFLGGTFFEKALLQRKTGDFKTLCLALGLKYVEISNGTISLPNHEKSAYIREFAADFKVLSEVGYKDEFRSRELTPKSWIQFIREDLQAGAIKVITESRESGKGGICRADGEIRYGLISELLESGIPAENLIFEAPTKELQVYFIRRLGSNCNFGNIALDDVISLETLRLGLRSETLESFQNVAGTNHPVLRKAASE